LALPPFAMNTIDTNQQTQIIDACQAWVDKVIIAHNFCPFAKRERDLDSIRYALAPNSELEPCIQFFADQLLQLDEDDKIETSLLIFAHGFEDFDIYLELLELSQEVLASIGFEGKYQLASFHPDYCFEGNEPDDADNYTNRSPYPMLHLIREDSVARAIASHPDASNIPQRNIAHAKELGKEKMQSILQSCYKKPTT
jgi:hypothetical protein